MKTRQFLPRKAAQSLTFARGLRSSPPSPACRNCLHLLLGLTSLVAQTVKHLPTMRETRFQSLGGEDPLEKEMATHSSILAWKIPWTEEPGGLQSMGSQRVGHDWATSLSLSLVITQVTVVGGATVRFMLGGKNLPETWLCHVTQRLQLQQR